MRGVVRSPAPVLIYAAVRRDVELLSATLQSAGFVAEPCTDVSALDGRLDDVLALLTTEELLTRAMVQRLRRHIDQQPVWSDFPIVVFTGPESNGHYLARVDELGPRANVTLVDRPVRMKSMLSLINAVERARLRQYEIRDLLAKLEDRIAERDRFLAILGHELRNPLGAIVLAAQMVDPVERKLDGEHTQRIERQAQHLSSLVDDLLDLSRVTTGKITLKRQPADLNKIVEQCLTSLDNDRLRRSLDVRFDPQAKPLILHADVLRVEQIVMNLLTNAFKYTPEGGSITVRTECHDDQAALVVSDTGVGISPDRIDSIFELFSQAENAIGRSQGGMGIGLHLVRTLAELHGGSVDARSEGINRGSRFTVRLPLAAEQKLEEQARPERSREEPACAGRHIVIIDDNADIRDLLQIKLKKLGHSVETAPDGPTGLHRIMTSRPEVAIIDIGMPGMDGYEVARQLRQTLSQDIFLIALTGFGQNEDKERAAAAGFDEHLTKPIRAEELQTIFVRRFHREGEHETAQN